MRNSPKFARGLNLWLETDPEGFAIEVRPDGDAVGLEPRPPLDEPKRVAIGVLYFVAERRVSRAWIYYKAGPRRAKS
jgi:hypothetical protein